MNIHTLEFLTRMQWYIKTEGAATILLKSLYPSMYVFHMGRLYMCIISSKFSSYMPYWWFVLYLTSLQQYPTYSNKNSRYSNQWTEQKQHHQYLAAGNLYTSIYFPNEMHRYNIWYIRTNSTLYTTTGTTFDYNVGEHIHDALDIYLYIILNTNRWTLDGLSLMIWLYIWAACATCNTFSSQSTPPLFELVALDRLEPYRQPIIRYTCRVLK